MMMMMTTMMAMDSAECAQTLALCVAAAVCVCVCARAPTSLPCARTLVGPPGSRDAPPPVPWRRRRVGP